MNLIPPRPTPPFYPESDGKPMADNTKQARWIFVLFGNIAALFRNVLDVFVAADLFWYAVEGVPEEVTAPDVFVVFGRPKGDRRSYQQWVEGNIPATVAFEVLSPKNTVPEMIKKQLFYEDYGVEEYYLYDPETNSLHIYLRKGDMLRAVRPVNDFVSPRLGIRFHFHEEEEMVVYGPDGQRFLTFEELTEQYEQARRQVEDARRQVEDAWRVLDNERQQRLAGERLAEQGRQRATRLAELSRKARRQEASPEELQELEGLEIEIAGS
jgi:Uma2 family endonuclease